MITNLTDVNGYWADDSYRFYCLDDLGHQRDQEQDLWTKSPRAPRNSHNLVDSWMFMESLDSVTRESLSLYDEHYAINCGPLIMTHDVFSKISI